MTDVLPIRSETAPQNPVVNALKMPIHSVMTTGGT